jgi:Protein of unknown function (DUF1573)
MRLRAARVVCSALVCLVLGWVSTGVAEAAATNTTAFTSPGQYSFTVPEGVRSVTVIAIGAAGGSCLSSGGDLGGGGVGGAGAALTATVPVVPGATLFVGVGAPGAPCAIPAGGAGGAGGGGAGGTGGGNGDIGFGGGGGGGASVVGVSSPSPALGAGLLVVAGAGGGGAQESSAPGGAAGSPGGGDAGGGPGGLTSAGGGGQSPDIGPGNNGGSGAFAVGGGGGVCSRVGSDAGGGGGGGSGYWGGGGGGCDSGGGGGGSSFLAPGVTALLGPTPTTAPSAVSITYPAPTVSLDATALRFPRQAPGAASPAQVLTVTNRGSAPLVITGVQLAGENPDDFLVTQGCQQPVAVGSSCQVAVRFDPQAEGDRSATLRLVANTSRAATTVSLSGAAVAGVTVGAPGHNVDVLNCNLKARKVKHHSRVKTEMCSARVLHGRVEFSTAPDWTRATLKRHRAVYATGASIPTAHGGTELLLNARRALKRGNYVLILRTRRARRWVTRRLPLFLR